MPEKIRVEVTHSVGKTTMTYAAEACTGEDAVEAVLSAYDRHHDEDDDERDA